MWLPCTPMHHSPFKPHDSQKDGSGSVSHCAVTGAALPLLLYDLHVSGADRKHPPHSEWSHRRCVVPSGVAVLAALTAHLSHMVDPRSQGPCIRASDPATASAISQAQERVQSTKDEILTPAFNCSSACACSSLHAPDRIYRDLHSGSCP